MNTRRFSTLALVAAAALCIAGSRALADGPKGSATIKGVVKIDAEAPKAMAVNMGADPVCAKLHSKPVSPQGKMVFPDKTLPYAFVYIKSGIEGKYDAPSDPLEITQEGCMYKPHVAGMIAGQPIKIVNSDPTSHNIHSMATKNPKFNFSQPQKDMVKLLTNKDTFTRPEVMVFIKCDVHPWMGAYVGVLTHPFYSVTGKGGAYEIKGVPAGKYTLGVWHEEWGELEAQIDVTTDATVEQNFTYTKKAAKADVPVREVTIDMSGG